MKKIFSVMGLMGLVFPVFAQPAGNELTRKIQEALLQLPSNAGAIKRNRVVHFQVQEAVYNINTNAFYGDYRADIFCKAYALDVHWLITSASCLRIYQGDLWRVNDHRYLERERTSTLVASERTGHFAQNNNLVLIWTTGEKTYNGPFVNILATSSPSQLAALPAGYTLKINTARFGLDGVRTRSISLGSIQGNQFELEESLLNLSGTATDPLFAVSKDGREFLTGYNNGINSYSLLTSADASLRTSSGLSSSSWFSLGERDLEFIQQTVQTNRPQDWQTIKTRLFFNQTQAPYLK